MCFVSTKNIRLGRIQPTFKHRSSSLELTTTNKFQWYEITLRGLSLDFICPFFPSLYLWMCTTLFSTLPDLSFHFAGVAKYIRWFLYISIVSSSSTSRQSKHLALFFLVEGSWIPFTFLSRIFSWGRLLCQRWAIIIFTTQHLSQLNTKTRWADISSSSLSLS